MSQMEYATSCPQDLEEKRMTSVNRRRNAVHVGMCPEKVGRFILQIIR